MENIETGKDLYILKIHQLLEWEVSRVQGAARMFRTDALLNSEHIFCGLLNIIFPCWNLVNANTAVHTNFPGVDLIDVEERVTVQVTATNTPAKVRDMLTKFKKHQLNKDFDRLILLIISNDSPTAAMRNIEDGCFQGKRDIWDIPYLLRLINSLDANVQKQICDYLEKEIGTPPSENNLPVSSRDDDSTDETSENTPPITEDTPDEADPSTNVKTEDDSAQSKFLHVLQQISNMFQQISDEMHQPGNQIALVVFVLLFVGSIFLYQNWDARVYEQLDHYSLVLNGETVYLPTTFQRMQELGWEFVDESIAHQPIAPLSYDCNFDTQQSAELTNGYGTLTVGYGNPSNQTLLVEDCAIYQLFIESESYLTSYTGEIVNSIECPFGLVMGEDIPLQYNLYDILMEKRTFYVPIELDGIYELDEGQWYGLGFDSDAHIFTGYAISNLDLAAMLELSGPNCSMQVPDYDADALADHIGAQMAFHTDGPAFPLGCAISTYADLEYKLDKAPKFMVSREHDLIYFLADVRHQLIADACNPFSEPMQAENCFICRLSNENIQSADDQFTFICTTDTAELVIPKGMSRTDLTDMLDSHGIEWKRNSCTSITFFPNSSNRDVTVTCVFSFWTRSLVTIEADCCAALQDFLSDAANTE